ncbi:MAG: FecR domain-containing protein [Pseudomonadota bacterium]
MSKNNGDKNRWPLGKILAGLMSIILAAGVAIFGFARLDAPEPRVQRHTSSIDENTVIILDDGTILTLSGASRAVVLYSDDERRVELQNGSGYFEVAPQEDRLFVAVAGNTAAQATGAVFEVRRSADDTRVSVVEGSVVITNLAAAADNPLTVATVKSGERLRTDVSGKRLGKKEAFDREVSISWLNGRLAYDGARLADVVADMNRYRSAKIKLTDPSLGELRITASFPTDQTDALLDALSAVYPITVKQGIGRVFLDHAFAN